MVDVAFAVRADLERLLDVSNLTLSGSLRYDSTGYLSAQYVGDVQGVSNIDAPEAWRLYELWLEWRAGQAALGAGLYDLNSDFDVSQTALIFLNGSHGIGPDIALSGRNGPSIFPVTGLALRFSYDLTTDWTTKLAVLDGVPGDRNHPSRFVHAHLSSDEGALLVGELAHAFLRGSARLGLWRYTQPQEHLDSAGAAVSQGVYVGMDTVLTEDLRGFARYGPSSEAVNPVSRYAAVGIVFSTPIGTQHSIDLGIAVNRAWLSDGFRATLSEPARGHETNVELTARIALTPSLALQPDVQWIIDPARARDRDALVIGLRIAGTLAF